MADRDDIINIEATALASFSLAQDILRLLVKSNIMTEIEMKDLVLKAASEQRSLLDDHGVLSPANERAAKILEELASKIGVQFR
jgi:hypothetical protein